MRTQIATFALLLVSSMAGMPAAPAADKPGGPAPIVIDEAPAKRSKIVSRLWVAIFAPDGKSLAVTAGGGGERDRDPGELVIWNIAARREVLIKRQKDTIRTAAFSRDGKLLAIGDFAGRTQILDSASGKTVAALPNHKDGVNCVVFSPDDKLLLSAGLDDAIQLFDVKTHAVVDTFRVPHDTFVAIAVSADGKYLAAGTWEGKALVWDLPERRLLHTLEGGPGKCPVDAVAFAPHGETFVTGSWDGPLRLWDARSGKVVRELQGETADFRSAAFSPDGKTFATGDTNGRVLFWNPATGRRLGTLQAHRDHCFGLAFSPDGKQLATASWDRTAKVWDLEHRLPIAVFSRNKKIMASAPLWRPSGSASANVAQPAGKSSAAALRQPKSYEANIVEETKTADGADKIFFGKRFGKMYWQAPRCYRIDMEAGYNLLGAKTESQFTAISLADKPGIMIDHQEKAYYPQPPSQTPFRMLEKLADFTAKADRTLGDREIDGKKAHGFQIDMHKIDPRVSEGRSVEIWIDKDSHLPLEVKTSGGEAVDGLVNSERIESIRWNVELAPKLFDATPPKGYEKRRGP